jgi:uncharacterized protein
MKCHIAMRAAVACLMMLPWVPAFAQKPPTAATALDPARIAAAKELMAAKGGTDALKKVITELGAGIIADYRVSHPAKAAKIAVTIGELLAPDGPVSREYVSEAMEKLTVFHATRFTASELEELKTFYLTPTGKKYQELSIKLEESVIEPMAKVAQSINVAVAKVFKP